ncbi:MAG: enediyne biosynthesis protein [Candidatus Binatota bacterium]|nr:enediyne biosynthesis protein [Candidatus Binatota bacterium]
MDMFEGVGRRLDQETGQLVNIGQNSLNGRERNVLFRNDRDGAFTEVAWVNAADRVEDGRGLSIFDYDRDGRPDLLIRNFRQPAQLLRNQGSVRRWIDFELTGTESNRDAIGAKIRVVAGELVQTREVAAGSGYLSGSSLVQHFGLGDAQRVDRVEIRWPAGGTTTLRDLHPGRTYRVVEGETPRKNGEVAAFPRVHHRQ